MRTPAITAVALTAALSLAACTNSNTTATQPATAIPPAANQPTSAAPKANPAKADLEKAVRAYSAAYFKPDTAAAYKMLSKRCTSKITAAVYAVVVEGAAKDYGQQDIKTLTVDQLSGTLARVSYTYGVPKLDQSGQPWALEDGAWRYDAC